MRLAQYFSGNIFKVSSGEIIVENQFKIENFNTKLIVGNWYILTKVEGQYAILPFSVQKESNTNNVIISNGLANINIDNLGNMSITLPPLAKMTLNNSELLTTKATINSTSPGSPVVIINSGQV
jgi:hypothetical protein